MQQLGHPSPRLLCSLIHKFGKKDVDNFEKFIDEMASNPSVAVGEVFVFVDECHRTQSGKLHRIMKAMLNNAVFIGFTGTPLLKQDRQTSLEVFGKYIHTYKFNEAVADEVVLDLVYEARDIDQRLSSPQKVDAWFEAKTKGLNDFQKSELKKKWGTMQKVLSSRSRMEKVVSDIVFDFSTKSRLSDHRGNAILVAGSIYEACKYYELFKQTEFKKRCAVITSYNPSVQDITTEDTGADTETEKQFIYNTYTELLQDVKAASGKTKTETYEDIAKTRFIKEPASMRLLIVVDKLLTGFDAPSCTYLYIDKKMQDHGLFQAICRVNRLDSEDKQFGYIVDYKELFKNLVNDQGTGAIQVYTSELDYDGFQKTDCDILMQDRIKKSRERLNSALETLALLCEPVLPPKSKLDYQHYFCGNTEIPDELKATELRRSTLYKAVVALVRAYANVAAELAEAGYSTAEQDAIAQRLDFYLKLREEIRIASGEVLDVKPYEADMRHLIDHYIQADEPSQISPFGDLSLVELIAKSGIADAIDKLPNGIKENRQAVAETIENNVRQKIIREHLIDPAFFEEMSTLLNELISQRRANALDYSEYLKSMADLATRLQAGKKEDVPSSLRTHAQRVLYNNLDQNEDLALRVHESLTEYKPDGWRGVDTKEKTVKGLIYKILGDPQKTERIFEIVKKQGEY
jgi:type I restriction enzyme R subunit